MKRAQRLGPGGPDLNCYDDPFPQAGVTVVMRRSQPSGLARMDEVTKGQCMRQLLTEPLRGKLLAKVRELPELESAIKSGTATLRNS